MPGAAGRGRAGDWSASWSALEMLGGLLAGVDGHRACCWPCSWPTPAAPGTTPRNTSKAAHTAARARTRTRPPWSATPSATPSRTPSGPRHEHPDQAIVHYYSGSGAAVYLISRRLPNYNGALVLYPGRRFYCILYILPGDLSDRSRLDIIYSIKSLFLSLNFTLERSCLIPADGSMIQSPGARFWKPQRAPERFLPPAAGAETELNLKRGRRM